MTKKSLVFMGFLGLFASSCIEHEVIPAPVPLVDLNAHFIGNINGTQTEYTENVLGYRNTSFSVKLIQPPGGTSTAVYYSEMGSTYLTPSIAIGLGSITFDSGVASTPPLSSFEPFFELPTNLLPNYSNFGVNGFEVLYTDVTGREWRSSEFSNYPGESASFSGVRLDSDSTGDYSQFICTFDCFVYSLNPDSLAQVPPVNHIDSFLIDDAIYTGWFKR